MADDKPTEAKPSDAQDKASDQDAIVTEQAPEPELNPDSVAAQTVSQQTVDEAEAATDPDNVKPV